MPTNTLVEGRVIQIAGPTIEIEFPEGHVPKIYNAIRVTSEGYDVPNKIDITAEVAQHIGEGRVRTIAMEPTDGLVRGMKAYDLGHPITIPVGKQTLGRVLNVLGKPVDNMGPVTTEKQFPIHRSAPEFAEQATEQENSSSCRGCHSKWFLRLGFRVMFHGRGKILVDYVAGSRITQGYPSKHFGGI